MSTDTLKAFIYIILFFIGLYAFVYMFVIPWLLPIIIAIALVVKYWEKILDIFLKLKLKKAPLKEEVIKIPEGTPPTVKVPSPEKIPATPEAIKQLVEVIKEQNKSIVMQQAQIAELRGQNDKLKEELERTKGELDIIRKWMDTKEVKEAVKHIAATLWLKGAPVTNKKGEKLGLLVAVVPNPFGPGLILITEDIFGRLRIAGWGMTWADPNYYPLIDPESWKAIQEEAQRWASSIDLQKGTVSFNVSPIKEHAIIVNEWGFGIPASPDAFAKLPHGEKPDPSIQVNSAAYARIIEDQRKEIDELKTRLNQLYDAYDRLKRRYDILKSNTAVLLLENESLGEMARTQPLSEQALVQALITDSQRADLHMREKEGIQRVSEELLDITGRDIGRLLAKAGSLVEKDRITITKQTLDELNEILEKVKQSPEDLLAQAAAISALKSASQQPERPRVEELGEEGEVEEG
ncbi:MAG: hypothetical protein DRN78_02230 [Thermoproteota archaeon]|nr:MAG: hypothetical protein DRN78_02230 [Candidatus Korarchaeota archaeon]